MLEEIMIAVTDDRPGILAEIGELLGRAGVNIETLAATNIDGKGVIHLVVDDGEDAGEVLAANGFEVAGSREVLTTTLEDRPGELGRYCRRLAEAGVAISSAYVAKRAGGESELILAVDDREAATSA
ncbi:MAG: ACT domain-containing protein [Actinomycetota bacterium]|nr:ACT domain-containing protein [Actinomycetota bacterium]